MGSCLCKRKQPSASRQEQLYLDMYRPVVVSLCDYPTGGANDCSIVVGERLNVVSDEGEWWRVRSTATGRECYIPCNYTCKVTHRWLFAGLSREKAEQLLLLPHNQAGSFLIRETRTHSGAFSLSVRRNTGSSWDSVKHYRIHRLPNGWCFISPNLTFASLFQLVDHYSQAASGLCTLLREPCFIQGYNNVPVLSGPPPAPVSRPPLNWREVDSTAIFSADSQESPISEGLRDSITSYLRLTEMDRCEDCGHSWNT